METTYTLKVDGVVEKSREAVFLCRVNVDHALLLDLRFLIMLDARRSVEHVYREDRFGAVHHEEWRLPCRFAGLCPESPNDRLEFFHPSAFFFGEGFLDSCAKAVEDHRVGTFRLSVGPGVCHGGLGATHGSPFPTSQPMYAYSSIWAAEDWATEGGSVKADWSKAPFIASYHGIDLDVCECYSGGGGCVAGCEARFSDTGRYCSLSAELVGKMQWVQSNYRIYDYCTDPKRSINGQKPVECGLAQY
ncbi:unnamed protein product [Urochloa humidicola]